MTNYRTPKAAQAISSLTGRVYEDMLSVFEMIEQDFIILRKKLAGRVGISEFVDLEIMVDHESADAPMSTEYNTWVCRIYTSGDALDDNMWDITLLEDNSTT